MSKFDYPLASWARTTKTSSMQEMLSLSAKPNLTLFGLGLPNPNLFPNKLLAEISTEMLQESQNVLQYGPSSGALKTHISQLMSLRGADVAEENVFLTSGAQQGIQLLVRLLIDSGDTVLIEETIYTGFQQLLEPFKPKIVTVPTDPVHGMDVDAVEDLLRKGVRPSFIYCIPNGHNPLGYNLTLEKRKKLVSLASHYHVPIIEDDPYGFLHYEQANLPPLVSFDQDWVLYVGSFSKILAPGVRMGWVVAPLWLVEKLAIIKEANDINTTSFSQQLVTRFIDKGYLQSHIQLLCTEYRERRNTMINALEEHLGSFGSWETPGNGMFVWLKLSPEINTTQLFKESIDCAQVAYLPGESFSVIAKADDKNSMRLNFSYNDHDQIQSGIRRLANLIKQKHGVTVS
ncbi:PLP-dependent aminotransferase family protein [Brevibacillus borstelensis]|uniref:aminotransferase-like domain-containing protein n=1 Tax=Brevibacillus borstelensis TaxID=45462 RepID=UPI0030BAA39F